jgi:hypothetical protein
MRSSLSWHNDQWAAGPNRSTAHLREFVARILSEDEVPGTALEAGCGAGVKMLHLADLFPSAHWTGVELSEDAVQAGRDRLDPERFTLRQGDLNRLVEMFGERCFDITFSIMVLSWIEDYEAVVEQMLSVTKGRLFILNLFADCDLDAFIRVRGRHQGSHEGLESFYNVYSLPRFLAYCRRLGASDIVAEPFEIDVDIPRPDHGGMGTWTERTTDGRRLQISGRLIMPWWFVAMRTS